MARHHLIRPQLDGYSRGESSMLTPTVEPGTSSVLSWPLAAAGLAGRPPEPDQSLSTLLQPSPTPSESSLKTPKLARPATHHRLCPPLPLTPSYDSPSRPCFRTGSSQRQPTDAQRLTTQLPTTCWPGYPLEFQSL
ncbi:hypothetical protein CC85DRAFT_138276 [Cutaneotrichosporon oleaginosum]|uniref:Uncharacterized protein n=1 Tax=Cutaneotrichosporon oleaginosum TaxID=879819 RepID=A0A0J0XIL3_9TREE|nr:uncharacterized protein CC85DRAFT_138276 [Cutaneotrichosporon oleaginosum]KLT40926.1 hypothetical protein CC85DRAFT_138276 [Cutaneotrichosporon oleaginosum]TXT15419.1 hypothetical protein COLE_01612 [Cutaneotrichosporon oleaginosum]